MNCDESGKFSPDLWMIETQLRIDVNDWFEKTSTVIIKMQDNV